jgi:hypothetical protein
LQEFLDSSNRRLDAQRREGNPLLAKLGNERQAAVGWRQVRLADALRERVQGFRPVRRIVGRVRHGDSEEASYFLFLPRPLSTNIECPLRYIDCFFVAVVGAEQDSELVTEK